MVRLCTRSTISIRYSLFSIRFLTIHHSSFTRSSPAETRTDRDALEDVPLQEKRQRDAGQHGDRGAGHQQVPIGSLLALESGEAERDGGVIGIADDDQRPQ